MARGVEGWLSQWVRSGAARHWAGQAEALTRGRRLPPPELRDEAMQLHRSLGRFLQLADARMPRAGADADLLDLPPGTDWHWRPLLLRGRSRPAALSAPPSGQRLGDDLALFHDCPHRALILRQTRNHRATDLAPYGLLVEMLGFSGSYLSLSLDLPAGLNEDLGRHHVLRLDATLHAERSITAYARLNVAQGPNTESMLRHLGHPVDGADCRRSAEFDLGYVDLSQRPIDKVWLDLIFESPYMNAVSLSDAVLSRRPRAEI